MIQGASNDVYSKTNPAAHRRCAGGVWQMPGNIELGKAQKIKGIAHLLVALEFGDVLVTGSAAVKWLGHKEVSKLDPIDEPLQPGAMQVYLPVVVR